VPLALNPNPTPGHLSQFLVSNIIFCNLNFYFERSALMYVRWMLDSQLTRSITRPDAAKVPSAGKPPGEIQT